MILFARSPTFVSVPGLIRAQLCGTTSGLEKRTLIGSPRRAVIDRGFSAGLPEVYAVVRPGNEPSIAVCRRLGMDPLGRMRRWYDVELEAFRLMAPPVVD